MQEFMSPLTHDHHRNGEHVLHQALGPCMQPLLALVAADRNPGRALAALKIGNLVTHKRSNPYAFFDSMKRK
jgi:hypothetical protein